MRQFKQLRYLFEPEESVRLDSDVVLGYEIKHALSFAARCEEGPVDADVSEYKLGERDGDVGWLKGKAWIRRGRWEADSGRD